MKNGRSRLWVLTLILFFAFLLFSTRQLFLSYTNPVMTVDTEETEKTVELLKELPLSEACAALIPVIAGSDAESNPEYENTQGTTKSDALVTNIDYVNKKITLDFITVELNIQKILLVSIL